MDDELAKECILDMRGVLSTEQIKNLIAAINRGCDPEKIYDEAWEIA